MKKKIFSAGIVIALLVTSLLPIGGINLSEASKKDEFSILFTHDMHSHFMADEGMRDGITFENGGLAKIATVKEKTEKKYKNTFLLDAGDFSMGTPFQTIFKDYAAEIRLMGKLGFDATTLGNHEFDYKAFGLRKMLRAALKHSGEDDHLPQIVQANIDWDKSIKNKKNGYAAKRLKKAFQEYGVDDYTIIKKGNKKIAVFGVMGPIAISEAPLNGLKWHSYIKRAKKIVSEIKRNGEADLIVCLSHSGTVPEGEGDSEDEILAEKVPDIDIIVSGHTHRELKEPIKVGSTLIASIGAYNKNVGHIVVKKSGDHYQLKSYKMIPLDKSVKNDSAMEKEVESFIPLTNEGYFNKYGMKYDKVLIESKQSFGAIEDMSKTQAEQPLANLIADAYRQGAYNLSESKRKADVAIIPRGTIRDSISKGDVTVADVYKIAPLGTGPNGRAGYPIVSIFLTGKELKACAEVDASIAPGFPDAALYFSGLSYKTNKNRLIFNRATDVTLMDYKGKKSTIDDNKLYKVVGSLYSCQMLSVVMEKTHGLIAIEPKDYKGRVIKDFEKHIVYTKDGTELKEWYAIAKYLQKMPNDKIPTSAYKVQGRKIISDTINPIELLKQPNKVAFMLFAILLIPVVIIVGIVIFFIRRKHERRGYSRSMFGGNKSAASRGLKYKRPRSRRKSINMSRGINKRKWF